MERGPSKCNMAAILKGFGKRVPARLDPDLLVWVRDVRSKNLRCWKITEMVLKIKNQARGEPSYTVEAENDGKLDLTNQNVGRNSG